MYMDFIGLNLRCLLSRGGIEWRMQKKCLHCLHQSIFSYFFLRLLNVGECKRTGCQCKTGSVRGCGPDSFACFTNSLPLPRSLLLHTHACFACCFARIVWFQKMSILSPQKGLEILRGGRGLKGQKL